MADGNAVDAAYRFRGFARDNARLLSKSVYEKSTQPGAKFILKLTVTEGIIKERKTTVVFIEKATDYSEATNMGLS